MWHLVATILIIFMRINENCSNHPMNTVCISTKNVYPRKGRGRKHRASPPLQKVGGHIPLPTHECMPMQITENLDGTIKSM